MANEQTKKVVPGIPLAALDAITDRNTRDVLRALVDGHHVRNGNAGNGDDRFVTAAEIGLINGRAGSNPALRNGGNSGDTITTVVQVKPTDIGRIVNELQSQVIESPLFIDLGKRITLIDSPQGLVAQLGKDLTAAADLAKKALDNELLAFDNELLAFGKAMDTAADGINQINTISSTSTSASARQISTIKSTVYDATGALPLASGAILAINDVSVTSTSASARALAGVKAQVNDPTTGLAMASAAILAINDVSATSTSASARTLAGVKAQVNDPTTGLAMASAAILAINQISATSTSAAARALFGLNAKVIDPVTGLPGAFSQISDVNDVSSTSKSTSGRRLAAIEATVNTAGTGLSAKIVELNTVDVNSTSANARSLAGLISTVTNPLTGLAAAVGMIAVDRAISVTKDAAAATANALVYAALGARNRSYYSSSPPPVVPEVLPVVAMPATAASPGHAATPAVAAVAYQPATPVIGDIWYNTADKNKAKRWTGSGWVDTSDTRISDVEGGIADESRVALARDNAIVDAVKTIWASIGGNSGLIQGGSNITVNTAGATATAWNQVQAAIKDNSGNIISSATIRQDTNTLITKAGQLETKWVVNMDSGGLATGFKQAGFGITGTAVPGSAPVYAFGVRADEFWIAGPNDAGTANPVAAKVPFIVKTGVWYDSHGVQQKAGVYLNELFATSANIGNAQIKTAMIDEGQIDTLRIRGNAVTVPYANTFISTTTGTGINNWVSVASAYIDLDTAGVVFAASTGLIAYGQGFVPAQSRLTINGLVVSIGGGDSAWVNACHSAGLTCPAGRVTVQLWFAAENRARIIDPTLYIQGAKR